MRAKPVTEFKRRKRRPKFKEKLPKQLKELDKSL